MLLVGEGSIIIWHIIFRVRGSVESLVPTGDVEIGKALVVMGAVG